MSIFRKSEDHHAGSGLDKPDPKTLTEKITDTVKATLPSAQKTNRNAVGPNATEIPPSD